MTARGRDEAAITGWAWRTPLGSTVDEVTTRLLAGERAARDNPWAGAYACTLAAPIPGDPKTLRHRKFLRRLGLFAVDAAMEALAHAGLVEGPLRSSDPAVAPPASSRLGLFSGVGGLRAHWNELMPALEGQRDEGSGAWDRGLRLLHPFFMLQHLSNNAHALIAADVGARGEGVTFGGASAGAQALCAAARAIEAEAVDAALVVVYDSLIEPETVVELAERGAATPAGLPLLASPYDARADGIVPGEAACAVVLEPRGRAGSRALVYVDAADAADGTPGAVRAETIGHVVARVSRGRGLDLIIDGAAQAKPDLDLAEREALAAILDERATLLSIASATGYLGAATSLVQVIALGSALRGGRLPPIAGLAEPARGPFVLAATARDTRARSAIGISAGAPGLCGAVRVELP